jgi:hypothetical protein
MQRPAGTATGHRNVFAVDEDAALAELKLAWATAGYHEFSADEGTWSAIGGAGEGADRSHPGRAGLEAPGAMAGDAVTRADR